MFECEANGLYFLLVNVSDQEIDGYAFNESDSKAIQTTVYRTM